MAGPRPVLPPLLLLFLALGFWPGRGAPPDPSAPDWSPSPPTSQPCLVVTVLGATLRYQKYVWVALHQARALNPTAPFYLILNAAGYNASRAEVDRQAHDLHVQLVLAEDLQPTNLSLEFQRSFFVVRDLVPKDGNPLLLKSSMERVFLIHALALRDGLRHIFHIENDNMVYVHLPSLVPVMQRCQIGVAIPIIDFNQAALSFTYFDGAAALEAFCRHVVALYQQGRAALQRELNTALITDMAITAHFLRTVQNLTGGRRVSVLPSWLLKSDEPENCVWSAYAALFDGAAMGQFFGGTHSQPTARWYERRRPFKELNTKALRWRRCEHADAPLRCPWIDDRRVVNLHIHSKQLGRFLSSNHLRRLPK